MAIPPGGKMSKDAKECMQECASEFISFITSEYPSLHLTCCIVILHQTVPNSHKCSVVDKNGNKRN